MARHSPLRYCAERRVHGSIIISCKAVPDHHTTTTTFDCWYDALFMKYCVGFYTHTFQNLRCLISAKNICSKVLGIIRMVLDYVKSSTLTFAINFSHDVISALSLLLLNREH